MKQSVTQCIICPRRLRHELTQISASAQARRDLGQQKCLKPHTVRLESLRDHIGRNAHRDSAWENSLEIACLTTRSGESLSFSPPARLGLRLLGDEAPAPAPPRPPQQPPPNQPTPATHRQPTVNPPPILPDAWVHDDLSQVENDVELRGAMREVFARARARFDARRFEYDSLAEVLVRARTHCATHRSTCLLT